MQKLRTMGLESLFFFAKGILGFDWLTPHIHGPLCKELENRASRRKAVILPRGWLKTTLYSIAYPLWRATRNPNIRILLVQNTHTNACAKLSSIKALVEGNDLYRTLYPEIRPGKTWKADSLELKRSRPSAEATFEAAGTRTQIVSRHYDIIIEDDTVAPDLDQLTSSGLIPSRDDIEKAIGFHRLVPPLLVDPQTCEILVVGTRWYEVDLLSWIMENEPNYVFRTRACRETAGVPDPDGEITYPERFNDETLLELYNSMGPYMFSCLYMNTPVRGSDMIFKAEWFHHYETPPSGLLCYTTVDLAGDPEETKGDPDFNVVLTTGKDLKTGKIYVLEYTRERCNPGRVIDIILAHVRKYSPVKVGMEAVQYQRALIYFLREKMKTAEKFFTIEGITHGKKSKNFRIQGLQPMYAAGEILHRPHMTELEGELLAFPLAGNDDIGDCLSMQIPMWQITRGQLKVQKKETYDPFSLDSAVRELKNKHKQPVGSSMDVYDYNPLVMI